jgi:hypothetical protein
METSEYLDAAVNRAVVELKKTYGHKEAYLTHRIFVDCIKSVTRNAVKNGIDPEKLLSAICHLFGELDRAAGEVALCPENPSKIIFN